jgi:hypothetical protein
MPKLHFLPTIHHSSDMFQSFLIILRKLLNINKAHIKHRWLVKYIKICAQKKKSTDIIKFVCSSVKLVHEMALCWLPKHKLDIPLI